MFTGYSSLSMAAALPPGGRIVTCDVNPKAEEVARRHIEASPYADRIEIRMGPALDTIASLDGPFDLVFIDADKTNYRNYYEAVLPKLAPRGSSRRTTRCGAARSSTSDTSPDTVAIRAFNDHVAHDHASNSVQLTVRDGVTLIRKAEPWRPWPSWPARHHAWTRGHRPSPAAGRFVGDARRPLLRRPAAVRAGRRRGRPLRRARPDAADDQPDPAPRGPRGPGHRRGRAPAGGPGLATGRDRRGRDRRPDRGERARLQCIPVRWQGQLLAVITRESALSVGRRPGELERVYVEMFDRFARMIAQGEFPFGAEDIETEEAPRVGDGVLLLDDGGRVDYASPNAVNALHRMGIYSNTEGMRLDELGIEESAVRTAFATAAP